MDILISKSMFFNQCDFILKSCAFSISDTDDYARVALPTGPEEVNGQTAVATAADSSEVESVVEEEEGQLDGMMGFADLL